MRLSSSFIPPIGSYLSPPFCARFSGACSVALFHSFGEKSFYATIQAQQSAPKSGQRWKLVSRSGCCLAKPEKPESGYHFREGIIERTAHLTRRLRIKSKAGPERCERVRFFMSFRARLMCCDRLLLLPIVWSRISKLSGSGIAESGEREVKRGHSGFSDFRLASAGYRNLDSIGTFTSISKGEVQLHVRSRHHRRDKTARSRHTLPEWTAAPYVHKDTLDPVGPGEIRGGSFRLPAFLSLRTGGFTG